ncbi:MAG TPA: hypothetical protein VFS20_01730 [Longimicrobium sp.]|nr:hypothetical protein [Longimicrobium sp.]
MRVPSNRPSAILSCFLAVLGAGGLIFVAQVVSLDGSPFPPLQLAALAVASAAMLLVGVRGIARMNREMEDWVSGDHPWVREDVARTMGPVLAQWTYDRDEWEAWTTREYADRSRHAWGFGVLAGLIAGAMAFGRGAPLPLVAGAGVAMFAAGWLGWRGWAARMRRRNQGVGQRSITIAANAVLVDGKREFLCDATIRITAVRYLADQQPPVLTITVSNPSGMMKEYTARFPVPRGREDEARELADRHASGRWHPAPLSAAAR